MIIFLSHRRDVRHKLMLTGNSIKAKDSPWYAVRKDLSVASTVDAKVVFLFTSVNMLKVNFSIK